jgi:hypothetical protein
MNLLKLITILLSITEDSVDNFGEILLCKMLPYSLINKREVIL